MALTMRQWRRAKELTQEYMAEKLNVHLNTYQNWEKAPEKIRLEYAVKISEILDVPMNDIVFTEAGTV